MSDVPIFQTTLHDLIKGIRSNTKDSSSFISKEIADIKSELKCTDPFIKAEAVRKLTYLQMIGYNVSWAAFAIIEVMSQPRFGHKRIGYVAANQTFDENTELILLTTNLFKKEFSSSGTFHTSPYYDMGLAINCLANIATKDLARDCISDLVLLMNHTSPYIRKKAVLCMYKLYIKFPQGLRLTFDQLKERLEDSDSSVVSTAVNVICELANKNPKNYLAMVPKFFKLLTSSSSNWMLIKVIKLLGSLVCEEPRLARKLLEPLTKIIKTTNAKSLQYECIYTITESLLYTKRQDGSDVTNFHDIITMCSEQLEAFINENDQNLKYLGLVGLIKLMKSSPRIGVQHRDIVLLCLNDDDMTIRIKALEVLSGIVSRKSLVDLVAHLMKHARLSEGCYRDEVIAKILYMCRKEKYSLVSDFAWYTSVLLELAVMAGSRHGAEVADQLIEVALRVDTVRPYAVEVMLSMLLNELLVLGHARTTVCEVLKAAAWIVGEYSVIVTMISRDRSDSLDLEEGDQQEEDESVYWIEGATGEDIRSAWRGQKLHLLVMEALLHPRTTSLPAVVQKVYLQAALKVFIRASSDCDAVDLADILSVVRRRLPIFMQSQDLEVQERASTFRHILSEFGILSLNWEQSTEEINRETSTTTSAAVITAHGSSNSNTGLNEKEKELMDLLEFPMYTQTSVRAVDECGAKTAIMKSAVLSALTTEEFYAVHSKAQRRVPVPEEINLDEPLNSSALDRLLATAIPEDLNLSSLSLTQTYQPSSNAYASGNRSLYSQHADNNSTDEGRLVTQFGEAASISDQNKPSSFGPASAAGTAGDHSTVTSGYTTKVSDDVFMLSSNNSKNNSEIIPLSKILGDTFEDSGIKSRHGRSHKKSRSKRRSAEVNVVEMVPAGAVQSSDEDGDSDQGVSGRRRRPDHSKPSSNSSSTQQRDTTSKSRSNARRSGRKAAQEEDEDEMDLGGVDITTPLRADEVFHVPTHRVVPSSSTPAMHSSEDRAGIAATWRSAGQEEGLEQSEDNKKKKKSSKEKRNKEEKKEKGKKEKKSSSKHSTSKSKETQYQQHLSTGSLLLLDGHLSSMEHNQTRNDAAKSSLDSNLLGLDAQYVNSTPSVPTAFASTPAAAAMPPSASDRIAAMFDTAEASKQQQLQQQEQSSSAVIGAFSTKVKKTEKAKKASSGHFWNPAHCDGQLDVLYSVTCQDSSGRRGLIVEWKVINHTPDSSAVSVSVCIDSPLLRTNPYGGGFIPLVQNLPAGADGHLEMNFELFNPVEEALALPCRLAISSESLIGPDVRNVSTELHISVCAALTANKLSEEEFAQAVSQSSSAGLWGVAAVQVQISCKPKSAFKAIAGFLHASIVESEYSKAASMSARMQSTGANSTLYVLAKINASKTTVQLDIKYTTSSTKQEAVRMAQLIASALNDLSL